MHRPGIASIEGDKLILDGTRIEEVEITHRDTLVRALNEANRKLSEVEAQMFEQEQQKYRERQDHERKLRETAERLNFD
jgi:hypothetical protein